MFETNKIIILKIELTWQNFSLYIFYLEAIFVVLQSTAPFIESRPWILLRAGFINLYM